MNEISIGESERVKTSQKRKDKSTKDQPDINCYHWQWDQTSLTNIYIDTSPLWKKLWEISYLWKRSFYPINPMSQGMLDW